MKVLDRYIIRELIPPFLGGLGVILFVLLLDFLLDILNLIIAKGVGVFVVLRLFLYNLAWMFSLAVPMSSLVASLMAFGRLSGDSEITAAKALGIPFWRLMLPAALAMAAVSVGMVLFGDKVVPEANYRAKVLMVQIHRKKPLTTLRPRVFIDEFPGIELYVDRVDDRAGKLYGVTLYEKRRGQKPRVIVAPEGEVRYDPQGDAVVFTLKNGEIHELDPDDPERYIRARFSRQVIRIGDLGTRLGEAKLARRGDRELSISALKDRISETARRIEKARCAMRSIVACAVDSLFRPRGRQWRLRANPTKRALLRQKKVLARLRRQLVELRDATRYMRKLKVELHKKYSLPFACLAFLLVGAPVGAWARRGGLGMAVGLSFGFFLVYWAFLIGGEELADRGILPPALAMWSGNILMLVLGAVMLYRVTYEARFSGFGWFAKIFKSRGRR